MCPVKSTRLFECSVGGTVHALTEKELVIANASNKPPRGKVRDGPNDNQSSFVKKNLSLTGGSLQGPSRCDPKRGQRELASEFSVPDSEDMVFEAGCDLLENTEEFHVRLGKVMVGWGDSYAVTWLAFAP